MLPELGAVIKTRFPTLRTSFQASSLGIEASVSSFINTSSLIKGPSGKKRQLRSVADHGGGCTG